MNKIAAIIGLVCFLFTACNTVKENVDNAETPNSNTMVFTIDKIIQEKDGETLILKDEKGNIYTTVISIANGNYVEVGTGDKISLEAKQILEIDPPIIVSEKVEVIEKAATPVLGPGYEKVEELMLWINHSQQEAHGMDGEKIKCLQVQYGETMDAEKEWEVLCDEIEGFSYVEGKIYQLKIKRKWLKDHELVADRSPYDFELIEIIETKAQ